MTDEELEDLSDDELAARLRQRGYASLALDHFVENRDDPEVAAALRGIFDGD